MVRLIGAASGWGAQLRSCEEGPEFVYYSLQQSPLCCLPWSFVYPIKRASDEQVPLVNSLPLIHAFNNQLAGEVFFVLKEGECPIVIGGDHSIAVGTWNGVYQFLAEKNQLPLGLIWIDAHMDSHTPETTPSGAWHGMPLAALLGFGREEMCELRGVRPVLSPQNVCLIGVRSFEGGEAQLLHTLGVRIFFIDEVRRRGIAEVLKEAVAHVTKGTKAFGVSFDCDVIDPGDAPGVGSPEEGGIPAQDLLEELPRLFCHPNCVLLELVEFNPYRDQEEKTAAISVAIIATYHAARGGSEHKMASGLPPERNPNLVPLS